MYYLFKVEEAALIDARAYIGGVENQGVVDIERYVKLYQQFERFVKQTKRAMRLSDRMSGELSLQRNELTGKAYIDELRESGIILSYCGPIMQEGIEGIAATQKDRFVSDALSSASSTAVFSIFLSKCKTS